MPLLDVLKYEIISRVARNIEIVACLAPCSTLEINIVSPCMIEYVIFCISL